MNMQRLTNGFLSLSLLLLGAGACTLSPTVMFPEGFMPAPGPAALQLPPKGQAARGCLSSLALTGDVDGQSMPEGGCVKGNEAYGTLTGLDLASGQLLLRSSFEEQGPHPDGEHQGSLVFDTSAGALLCAPKASFTTQGNVLTGLTATELHELQRCDAIPPGDGVLDFGAAGKAVHGTLNGQPVDDKILVYHTDSRGTLEFTTKQGKLRLQLEIADQRRKVKSMEYFTLEGSRITLACAAGESYVDGNREEGRWEPSHVHIEGVSRQDCGKAPSVSGHLELK